jgi:hypothetical protein
MSEQLRATELTEEQSLRVSEILPKLKRLEEELKTENPGIQNYIKDINNNLREFPELLHLLSDEDIKPIYSALKQQTGVAIMTKKSKSRKGDKLLADGRTAGDLL